MAFPGCSRTKQAHIEGVQTEMINVLETPHSLAVSHDGSRVYVSHFRSGSVTLIDTATDSVATVLESGAGAYGVAPTSNDKFVHVAHPVRGLAISRDGAKLYTGNYFSSSVSTLTV